MTPMEQTFIKKEGSSKLSLFFAGWGMDETPFRAYCPDGMDYMVCYDYADMGFDYGLLSGYCEISLTAWSMGVWAAQKIFRDDLPQSSMIVRGTAINGTLLPADDSYGIPAAIFKGTLDNLTEDSLARFRRRMCSDTAEMESFMGTAPERDIESLRKELSSIWECLSANAYADRPGPWWTEAIICGKDRIFPAANQKRFWDAHGVKTVNTDGPHYCREIIKSKIECART